MRWFLVQVAQDVGCLVTDEENVATALTHMRASNAPVDLVLLDCPRTLEDLPGVAAIRRLRPACRMVLMTAFPSDAFIAGARALGAEHVLVKPIDVDDVRRLFPATRDPRAAGSAAGAPLQSSRL